MNPSSTRLIGSATVLLALGFAGCASVSSPFERSTPRDQVATRVDKAAAELAETNVRIDAALSALDDLVNHPSADLKRQYDAYVKAVDKLEDSAETLRKATDEMQMRGQEYFVSWDREIAAIHNEDLRTRSAERRAEVAERFEALRNSYINAREQLAPFLRRLNEMKTALEVDLTPAGLEQMRPTVTGVNDAATPARDAMRALSEDFRRAGIALAPEATSMPAEANR